MKVVWLASYPRSGVTFLRHVIERLCGIPTWSLYHNEDKATTLFDAKRIWPNNADGSLPVYFVKTHMEATAAANQPVIHLVRDGRDVIVSYAYFVRDHWGVSQSLSELIDGLVTGNTTLGHWGAHTLTCAGRQSQTYHITFDDLIAAPIRTVRSALMYLGYADLMTEVDESELLSFGSLRKSWPAFFRSGKHGQWRTMFSEAQKRRFNDLHGAAMEWFESINGAKHGTTARAVA